MTINNEVIYVGKSFSLKNRVGRVAWSFVEIILFRFSPKTLHNWRAFLLRCFGAKVGKRTQVYPGVKIWAPWNLELAEGSVVSNGVILYSQGKIIIGPGAVISQGAHLCVGTHDYTVPDLPLITKAIHIGAHAWVAAEAFIHPGVTIGTGCVIGARSVVTKDMPDWMVCSGHPCKPIKARSPFKNS